MAASDWTQAVLDHTGAPHVGEFDFGDGVSVKFNRGWINIYDSSLPISEAEVLRRAQHIFARECPGETWEEDATKRDARWATRARNLYMEERERGDVYPVASVNEGDLHYRGVYIRAMRLPTVQDGVMAVVYRTDYVNGEFSSSGMIGIACNGYARDEAEAYLDERGWPRYVGVLPESVEAFRAALDETKEQFAYSYGPEDVKERQSLGELPSGPFEDIPDVFRGMDLTKLRQINGGDLFFMGAGLMVAPQTEIGAPVEPAATGLIRKIAASESTP